MKTYYKVTNKDMYSCTASDAWRVKYKIGEWVKPKIQGTKLLCFDQKSAAKEFASWNSVIFECEVKNPISLHLIGNFRYEMFNEFWKDFDALMNEFKSGKCPYYVIHNFRNYKTSIMGSPTGTVAVDEIKLIRRV